MHKTNFRFKDLTYLEHGGQLFDLHNDFDFLGFQSSAGMGALTLTWQRRSRPWIPEGLPGQINLRFETVTLLEVHPRDPDMPPSEDLTLLHAGYVHPEFKGQIDGVTTEDMWAALSQDDPRPFPMIFAFQGGQVLVILANEASVKLD